VLAFFYGTIGKSAHKKAYALADIYFDHDGSRIDTMHGSTKGFSQHSEKR
jgi:hypothetical protein